MKNVRYIAYILSLATSVKRHDDQTDTIVINNNEEILLYYSKEPVLNSIMFHFKYATILTLLVTFIRTNPLYLTFPAALPISAFYFMYKYIISLELKKFALLIAPTNQRFRCLKFKKSS